MMGRRKGLGLKYLHWNIYLKDIVDMRLRAWLSVVCVERNRERHSAADLSLFTAAVAQGGCRLL